MYVHAKLTDIFDSLVWPQRGTGSPSVATLYRVTPMGGPTSLKLSIEDYYYPRINLSLAGRKEVDSPQGTQRRTVFEFKHIGKFDVIFK
jgi:hypothetical protein